MSYDNITRIYIYISNKLHILPDDNTKYLINLITLSPILPDNNSEYANNFSVSANTAIYMCACAAVFIISIPVLREKITIIKVS